ncbi:uncharacterized protein LOC125493782 [Beta vulgaris subsp. vulgaris]|uniref:uncharacterized protein LOC125493782 n=1 Tax=Beta vulgaris subsp. vulgaris TaxID=3555 RepID=UPI0020375610|nr:uncharacterized protein LOC125493782 [Beta vulgaris subsp. vulgaris]
MTELRWYSLSISSLRDVKVRVQSYVKACGLWEIGQARDLGLEFDFLLSIVFDNGPHFETPKLKVSLADQDIKAHFAFVAHAQENGQVEAFNKILSNGIKQKLDNAKEAVLPIEIEEPTLRVMIYLEEANWVALRTALDQVPEVRGNALLRMQLYELRMAREFNKRVTRRPLKVGILS